MRWLQAEPRETLLALAPCGAERQLLAPCGAQRSLSLKESSKGRKGKTRRKGTRRTRTREEDKDRQNKDERRGQERRKKGPLHASSVCTCSVHPDLDIIGGRSHGKTGRQEKTNKARDTTEELIIRGPDSSLLVDALAL